VAFAPPLTQDGNKEVELDEQVPIGAALRRFSVYSEMKPSLKTTV